MPTRRRWRGPTARDCSRALPRRRTSPATVSAAIELADAALRELDPAAEPVRTGFLYARRGWFVWNSGRGAEEALANLEEAIRLVPAEPPSHEHAEALSKLVRVLALLGHNDECRRRGEEALALVRRLGGRALESELLNSLGLSAANLGRQEEALALLYEALDVAQEAGDPECLTLAYTNLSSILGSYCRFEEAVSVALEGVEVSRRLGVELVNGLWCTANAAENLVDLGRFDEADSAHGQGARVRRPRHDGGRPASGSRRHDRAPGPPRGRRAPSRARARAGRQRATASSSAPTRRASARL